MDSAIGAGGEATRLRDDGDSTLAVPIFSCEDTDLALSGDTSEKSFIFLTERMLSCVETERMARSLPSAIESCHRNGWNSKPY